MIVFPSNLVVEFVQVSASNRSAEDQKLVETLAFLIGKRRENKVIGTHLIFPEQDGNGFRVDDKGKQFKCCVHCLSFTRAYLR